ncbi:electron transport complex subunit RsxG [Shewanella eurypsychrophilus]|uniref:Ion-translocating oxidoreductase complex subunit G n=1 Tax=Shewanella eurypsychrophilus TaxID=2593656 RepID=A0ABX6V5P1_9GAMM|nr:MULTISPECIES: electron transport complex subunit RsxG [Shewanella]QFU22653.1 electron transport complex subunit RsxG [Shewanella sp. YLB-09]QPG57942.1 electron transport complex subunit RsxG [Shewanella eurypsychrophilus]
MKNSMIRNGFLLGLFALLCTAFVAIVNQQTADKIIEQQQIELRRTLHQLIPSSIYDNELTQHCILIHNEEALGIDEPLPAYIASYQSIPVAIAIEAVAPDGYNGNIKLIIGIDSQGTVLGVRTLTHAETPGLGDKIDLRKSDWVLSFNQKSLNSEDSKRWRVKKDGGDFDQFTGATITPRAYVNAVKNVLLYFNENHEMLLQRPANCEVDYQ